MCLSLIGQHVAWQGGAVGWWAACCGLCWAAVTACCCSCAGQNAAFHVGRPGLARPCSGPWAARCHTCGLKFCGLTGTGVHSFPMLMLAWNVYCRYELCRLLPPSGSIAPEKHCVALGASRLGPKVRSSVVWWQARLDGTTQEGCMRVVLCMLAQWSMRTGIVAHTKWLARGLIGLLPWDCAWHADPASTSSMHSEHCWSRPGSNVRGMLLILTAALYDSVSMLGARQQCLAQQLCCVE